LPELIDESPGLIAESHRLIDESPAPIDESIRLFDDFPQQIDCSREPIDRFQALAGALRGGNVTLSTLRKVLGFLPNLEELTFEQIRG
jgi:hypothetical protein